jgi:hypothetical protein
LCWLFPADLLGGSAVGRFWSGFLAVFWGLRLIIQFAFYDRASRRAHPVVSRQPGASARRLMINPD